MRMWMVKPELMCRKHLLGEHVEIHMLIGSINKNKSLKGFIEKELIEPQNIIKRHEELSNEMTKRGYKHKSPIDNNFSTNIKGFVNIFKSYMELSKRCEECKIKINSL